MHFRQRFFTFGDLTGTCFSTFFNLFINDLYNVIKRCKYMLFADDLTTFHAILAVDNCILLQSDTENIPYLCTANRMKLNSSRTRFTAYIRKQMFFILLINYETLV